jgi:hypothetical protein
VREPCDPETELVTNVEEGVGHGVLFI